MKQYHKLVKQILKKGNRKKDRTKVGTKSLFVRSMRFDLSKGFPLITTKRVSMHSIIHELLWFLAGDTNIKYLVDNKVTIWNEWANENGDLGPVYGSQWRSWPTPDGEHIDQIENLIKEIKSNPDSRRHVVSAWNVAELKNMALPPCHMIWQLYVNKGKLSLHIYQRSADVFLGVPFNIASYALLTHMIAQQCDLEVEELIWTGGDCHLYSNHVEQAELQLSREEFTLPSLEILRKPDNIFDYKFEDFKINNYQHHPAIKAPIAV